MKKQLVRMLAVLGAMWNFHVTAIETPTEPERDTHAMVTLKTTGEARTHDLAEQDVQVTPKIVTKVGDTDVTYTGLFRKETNTDGKTSDLQTIFHKLCVGDDTLGLDLGRVSFRKLSDETSTVNFDNCMAGKGVSRTFTGAFAEYKPWDLALGVAAEDGEISPAHWDMMMASWNHRFDDQLGVQVHAAVGRDEIKKAGIAVEYKPTDKVGILGDVLYSPTETTGLLLGNYQLADQIKLFGGATVTDADGKDTTGRAVIGAEAGIGYGLTVYGGVDQKIGSDHDTRVAVGFKLCGSRDL